MVTDAGSPGIQKQIVRSESLKGMEGRYERVLQQLAHVIKVRDARWMFQQLRRGRVSPESSNCTFTPECCPDFVQEEKIK